MDMELQVRLIDLADSIDNLSKKIHDLNTDTALMHAELKTVMKNLEPLREEDIEVHPS